MRARSIISEALRDLVTGTTRAALFAGILGLVVGGLAVTEVSSVLGIVHEGESFRGSGAAVQVVASDGQVDGSRCDALTSIAGVHAAGAVRAARQVTALGLPTSGLTVWEATPGALDVLTRSTVVEDRSDTDAGGVWLSSDMADTLGVGPGSLLQTTDGPVDVSGVYDWPDDGRDRFLGYSIVAPVLPGESFDRCLADIWPSDDETNALLYTVVDGPTDQIEQRQLNAAFGTSFSGSEAMASRVTRHAPVAAAIGGVLVGYAASRSRRLEIAAALHARVFRRDLAWSHVIQASVWTIACGVALAAVTLMVAHAQGTADSEIDAWYAGLRTICAGTLVAPVGAFLAVVSVRERHLFRFFKDR